MQIEDLDTQVLLILDKDVLKRTKTVKKIANNWAQEICDIISETEEWKKYSNEPCNVPRLHHLSKGTIKNQKLRRIYMDATEIYINKHLEKRAAQNK
jgi:CMP-N-acetylneuraminic acid synthetase